MNFSYEVRDPFSGGLPEVDTEVFRYWDAKRGDAFAPAWGTFSLDELPPNAVPWCTVLDVSHDPLDFVFRFWGSARRELLGQEVTGKRLKSAFDSKVVQMTWDQNLLVLEKRAPLYFDIVATRDSMPAITYGILRLPLSDNGVSVDKLFTLSYNAALRQQLHSLFGTVPTFQGSSF